MINRIHFEKTRLLITPHFNGNRQNMQPSDDRPITDKRTPEALGSQSRQAPGQITAILMEEGQLTETQLTYALRIQSKLETPRPLLNVLKELEYVTDNQIKGAIRKNFSSFRIGDLLVELGHINELQLKTCLKAQAQEKSKRKLGELLVAHNFIREQKLLEILSVQLGIPLIEVEFSHMDATLTANARSGMFREFMFLPVRREGDRILVAFADPGDSRAITAAKRLFQCDISLAIARKGSIEEVIKRIQAGGGGDLSPPPPVSSPPRISSTPLSWRPFHWASATSIWSPPRTGSGSGSARTAF